MKSMKIALAALVAVIFVAGSASAGTVVGVSSINGGAGTNFVQYNGHWYGLTDAGTWDQALSDAQDAGVAVSASAAIPGSWTGTLVKVDDAAENDWLWGNGYAGNGMFDSSGNGQDLAGNEWGQIPHLWIGSSDAASEGTWVWTDGTDAGLTAAYQNWGSGEPSNGYPTQGDEDWGAIRNDRTGTWNDYSTTLWTNYGYGQIQGIIELAPVSTPAPGAILIAGIGTVCVGYLRRRRGV